MFDDSRKKQFLFALQTTLPQVVKEEKWKRPDDWLPFYPPIEWWAPRKVGVMEEYTDSQVYDNAIMVLSRGKGEISIDATCYCEDAPTILSYSTLSTRFIYLNETTTDTFTFDDDDMRWSVWYTINGKNLIFDIYSQNCPEILEIVVGKEIGRSCNLDPVIIDSSINTPVHLAIPAYTEDMSRICDTRGCECVELYGNRENYEYKTYTKITYKEEN